MNSDASTAPMDTPAPGPKSRRRAAPSRTVALAEGDAPINILIVDDEPTNLTVLETVLDDPQYRLVRAESADEALLALVAEQFALLILDIRMPGMTGFELAQVIKERKKTARVPIIFLTAYYSEDQHVLEGYDTGAVDYLHKPVNPSILRSKVAVFAELHRKSMDAALANQAMVDEVAERRHAEEQLRDLNETLEQRVTERTEALREADRLKDEFLAMLGHELRNPLSAIMNAMQLIHATEQDPERVAWALGLVDRQTRNLGRIVDDLLDVARITRGRIELRRQPVDLTQVIEQAVEVVRPLLNGDDHALQIIPAAASLRVDADLTRLEQSVLNLLLNAIKYTSAQRRITIAAERVELEATITVRDNGIGIAPEMLPRIFDLFTQADRSLDRAQGGLGIGLYICRQLIELHGGSVSASSDGIGSGAQFIIKLPALHESTMEARPAAPATEATSGVSPATGRRVLLVDDNVDSAMTLSWLLSEHGYTVRIAHDGPEGLKAAYDFKPEVLLLDLGLPGIDGFELARRLRLDGFAAALMIAISGYAHESDIQSSRAAGFDRHFAKPVKLANLLAAIDSSDGSSAYAVD
jgi:signal transduction histidine kinase